MQTQRSIVLTNAIDHGDIIRLLETDSIPVIIANHTALNDRPESSIKKNSRTSAAVQVDIGFFIAVDNKVFNSCPFKVVGTDNRKDRCGPGFIVHHAVRHQRVINGKRISVASGDASDGGMKSS